MYLVEKEWAHPKLTLKTVDVVEVVGLRPRRLGGRDIKLR